ncbi:MAG: hypothetical protein ACHQXA_03610 [Gemmatimonadales bacterium]
MRITPIPLLLLALAACTSRNPRDPIPGSTALLTGSWELVAHRTGQPDIHATVTLAPSAPTDSTVPAPLKGGTLEGHFRLGDHGWLPSPPTDSGVSAFIASDSAVILYLRLEGRCSNCGNLGFAGRLADGEVTGHWTQELTAPAAEGTFTLRGSSSSRAARRGEAQ